MRRASEDTTAMMTVGSVRGKERFDIPVLVGQDGRSLGVAGVVLVVPGKGARSVGGQARFQPPFAESVGWPHPAQKGFRAFQSIRCRPSA